MSIKDRLCQHLCQAGLHSRESARFASMVSKWVKANGPVETVERLKGLSAYYKERLVSNEVPIPKGWASRTSRKGNKVFSDNFIRRTLESTSGNGLRNAQALIRSYQIIKLARTTGAQMDKFVDAVEARQPDPSELVTKVMIEISLGNTLTQSSAVTVDAVEKELVPLSHWPMPSGKRSPNFVKVPVSEKLLAQDPDLPDYYYESKSFTRDRIESKFINYLLIDNAANELWQEYPTEVSMCITGDPLVVYPYSIPYHLRDAPAGNIALIQENGAKLRSVANPYLVIQAMGEPLKLKLDKVCQALSSCYVHDQPAALARVGEWIKAGHKVWSFDASSFTDSFPYSLQRVVLQHLRDTELVSDFDIAVFDMVVSKPWNLPKDELPESHRNLNKVTWRSGQPMGFGPSFFLATVTHVACLQALSSLEGHGESNDLYMIVGDDIVIRDPVLADSYRTLMGDLGVKINMQKSMISSSFSEFCGKIITEQGPTPSIKTKFYSSDTQIVDSLKYYGPSGFDHLTDRERVMAVKAFLPEFLGGIGLKPSGTKYAEYLKILDIDRIQSNLLFDEMTRFYGNVPSTREVQTSLEALSNWYAHVADVYSVFGQFDVAYAWSIGRDILGSSEWTGLPVYSGICDKLQNPPMRMGVAAHKKGTPEEFMYFPNGTYTSNSEVTFNSMVDDYARAFLAGNSFNATSPRAREVLFRVASFAHGYLLEDIKVTNTTLIPPITEDIPNDKQNGNESIGFAKGFEGLGKDGRFRFRKTEAGSKFYQGQQSRTQAQREELEQLEGVFPHCPVRLRQIVAKLRSERNDAESGGDDGPNIS